MFYGLDVHKEFIQVCALGAKGTKRREFRVAASAEAVERFARGLRSGDHVVLEATFHTWALHDILTRHVRHVVVANPLQVKAIAHAKVKTDKVDAYTLARLLRADFIPEVQMPDQETWALRQLVSHRRLLVKQRTATKNAIHAVLNRQLIKNPHPEPFSQRARKWMSRLELPPAEAFLIQNSMMLLEDLDDRIGSGRPAVACHRFGRCFGATLDHDPRCRHHGCNRDRRRHWRRQAVRVSRQTGFLLRSRSPCEPVGWALPPRKHHQGRHQLGPSPRRRGGTDPCSKFLATHSDLLARSSKARPQRRGHSTREKAHRGGLASPYERGALPIHRSQNRSQKAQEGNAARPKEMRTPHPAVTRGRLRRSRLATSRDPNPSRTARGSNQSKSAH